jgi:CheY-like chemotaxis protein
VKFTPEGGRVDVELVHRDPHVEVTVRDTGIGIRPEFLPHVFERFTQADGTTARRHQGLGLGLAIVRHLVELHGGQVRADSDGEGCGATFTVALPMCAVRTLPLPPPAEAACAAAPDRAPDRLLAGLHVLVVDDEEDARDLLETVLARYGAEVTLAMSARHGLEALERLRPDVLLADIGMPGESGYDLVRWVRDLPPDRGGGTPAAALTAYGRAEDRLQALAAGFQQHIPKPVRPDELALVVAALAGRMSQS